MASKYCLNCGEPVTPGMKRCPVCGSVLRTTTIETNHPVGLNEPVDSNDVGFFPSDPTNVSQQNNQYNYEDSDTLDLPTFEEDSEPTEITPVVKEEAPSRLSRSSKYAPSKTTAPKKNIRQDDYDEDDYEDDFDNDDYDDDYDDNPHTGLIIFLIIIIILLLAFSLLLFFKPALIDKGLSMIGIETHFSSETITTTADPSPTITASASTSPESTATSETTENAALGKITITIDRINIRSTPSTASDSAGTVNQNETYDYYETTESEGYTWYRIGENQWIADAGDWVSIN